MSPISSEGTFVALGNFDGVHLGHRVILSACAEAAEREGLTSLVWSFRRHPEEILFPEERVGYLTTAEEKKAHILSTGIHRIILAEFEAWQEVEPKDFCDRLLLGELNAKKVFCGFNFRFGKNGRGDAEFLRAYLEQKGVETLISAPVCMDGSPISSTRIRSLLEKGDVESAARLLGRPHSITLPVSHGKKLGRRLGFPTINQIIPPSLAPLRFGVYGVTCRWDGEERIGLCNVGRRPTVDADDRIIAETYLYDFDGDLYEKKVTTEFSFFTRGEKRFETVDELKDQILKDREEVFARWKEMA